MAFAGHACGGVELAVLKDQLNVVVDGSFQLGGDMRPDCGVEVGNAVHLTCNAVPEIGSRVFELCLDFAKLYGCNEFYNNGSFSQHHIV
jgi:hypothetical protein